MTSIAKFGPGITEKGVFHDRLEGESGNYDHFIMDVISESGVAHHAEFVGCTDSDAAKWAIAAYKDDLIPVPGRLIRMSGGVALG